MRPDLDRQPSGNLAHGCQQRQAAMPVGHGFVGNPHRSRGHQCLGHIAGRRQMKIGKQDLALPQQRELLCLRLLDLHDHVRCGEHGRRVRCDLGTNGQIIRIIEVRAKTCAGFDNDLVPVVNNLAHR